MLVVSVPAAALVEGLDAFLEVVDRDGFERGGYAVADAGICFGVPKGRGGVDEVCLQHVILGDGVENRQLLGAEMDDGHWISVVPQHHPAHTEAAGIVDCDFEERDARAGKK